MELRVAGMTSLPAGGVAVVAGAGGAIGAAIADRLDADPGFARVVRLSRSGVPSFDIGEEASIIAATDHLRGCEIRLVVDATGFLHDGMFRPEKALRDLDAAHLAHAFAINAIGPALLMKHVLPLLPRHGRAVFATLSARVGSIGDNRLGGWYAYRASKAALNQLVRTAAVELRRSRPEALAIALHPGTVHSHLSRPFAKGGLDVQTPEDAARRILAVIDGLGPADHGGFLDQRGDTVPW